MQGGARMKFADKCTLRRLTPVGVWFVWCSSAPLSPGFAASTPAAAAAVAETATSTASSASPDEMPPPCAFMLHEESDGSSTSAAASSRLDRHIHGRVESVLVQQHHLDTVVLKDQGNTHTPLCTFATPHTLFLIFFTSSIRHAAAQHAARAERIQAAKAQLQGLRDAGAAHAARLLAVRKVRIWQMWQLYTKTWHACSYTCC